MSFPLRNLSGANVLLVQDLETVDHRGDVGSPQEKLLEALPAVNHLVAKGAVASVPVETLEGMEGLEGVRRNQGLF